MKSDLTRIKQQSPLIHNITNLVVMQTTANVLLALGASPIMAHAKPELAEITALANALVINIGTLDPNWIESIEIAQQTAHQHSLPIVFDPVGAGASSYRTQAAIDIIKRGVSVVRGNASEIRALAGLIGATKGVDSMHSSTAALDAAKLLAEQYQCCVVVSGKIDIICYQNDVATVESGTPLLQSVTGMGCSATAMIGAFIAVNPNPLQAAKNAMNVLGLAAEKAETLAQGPGSFFPHLLDSLYHFAEYEPVRA